MQHTGWSPVTHHTTPSHRVWVTIDYKHKLQSIHSTPGRSAETYPTTLSHRDWDLPVHTYWSTGWDMSPQPWGLKPRAWPLSQWNYLTNSYCIPAVFDWYTIPLITSLEWGTLTRGASQGKVHSTAMVTSYVMTRWELIVTLAGHQESTCQSDVTST